MSPTTHLTFIAGMILLSAINLDEKPQAYAKRIPFDNTDFDKWKWRINPANFDETSDTAYYDKTGRNKY